MTDYHTTNTLGLSPGIYFNSKSCRLMAADSTKRNSLMRKLKQSFRNSGNWETKLKVAWCLFVIAITLATVV